MELVVNDLLTHLKARRRGRRKFNLSLQTIKAMAQQALLALKYLHKMGVTHIDLKPRNILVTNWDALIDIPTIKLADFGLAGIRAKDKPEHSTFCGTKGYVAPEMKRAYQRVKELKMQRDRGMKMISGYQFLHYNQSVDIWALGKILQELVDDYTINIPGKSLSENKRAALELICRMMENDSQKRSTAAECLKDLWIITSNLWVGHLAQKRGRSSAQFISNLNSSTEQPVQKVIRKTYPNSISVKEGSTSILMNALWSNLGLKHQSLPGPPIPGDTEMNNPSLAKMSEMRHKNQATQLAVRIEGARLSAIANNYGQTDLEVSSSMQHVIERLRTAFKAEGYGNNLTVVGNDPVVSAVRRRFSNLNISHIQKPDHSNVVKIQLENKEWINSLWSEFLQRSFDQGIGSNPTTPAIDNSRVQFFIQGFDEILSPLSLNKPRFFRQKSIAFHEVAGNTLPSFPLSRSDSNWDVSASKRITYPSNFDDPTAGVIF